MSKLEYLDENYKLHVIDVENDGVPKGWILVPEGAESAYFYSGSKKIEFYKKDLYFDRYDLKWLYCDPSKITGDFVWQRESKSELVDSVKIDTKKMVAQIEVEMATLGQYSHYFKDVRNLNIIDVYRVLKLFEVYDPCIQHAVKKLLCGGKRGAKDIDADVKEAIDTLIRYQEMRKEDK